MIKTKINYIVSKSTKKFSNISEYGFSLLKTKIKLDNNSKINIYLKMIEKGKVKESIFCYWSLLYEKRCKTKNNEIKNRAIITELEIKEERKSVLIEVEDNSETSNFRTVIYFIDFIKYLKNDKKNTYKNEKIIKYLKSINKTTLLIGIELNGNIKIM